MFELDLFFATGERNVSLEAHVAGCARCAGYLQELGALQAQRAVPTLPPAPLRARAGARRGPWLGLAAAALVALFVVLLSWVPGPEEPAVAVKGGPAVQLLVRRGEQTRVWDGAAAIRAGDVLGLRVACAGFSRVAVAVAEGGGWARVQQQACPDEAGAFALPFTLVVDGAPGRERLAVVFSAADLEAPALGAAVSAQRRDGRVWVTRFELAKEMAP